MIFNRLVREHVAPIRSVPKLLRKLSVQGLQDGMQRLLAVYDSF